MALYGLKNNDELALKAAFDSYHYPLFKYAFDKTKSADLAKDIVQLTFIKLWQYRNALREDIELSHQIFRIARTIMIDELRRVQTMRKIEGAVSSQVFIEDVNESVSYNDAMHRLEELIRQMPPMRQRIFRLSRLNQYSYKEISEMLSISTKTVENHINLALKFIKPFFSTIVLVTVSFF